MECIENSVTQRYVCYSNPGSSLLNSNTKSKLVEKKLVVSYNIFDYDDTMEDSYAAPNQPW